MLIKLHLRFICTWMTFVCTLVSKTHESNLVKLGSFKVPNPAFVAIYENPNATDPKDRFDLLVSTFSAIPLISDLVVIVRKVGNYMNNVDGITPYVLTKKTTWPNEVHGIPVPVFNKRMVVIPDGFLVPLKTNGAVRLMDVSSDIAIGPYVLTDGSSGEWFYHRVRWHDMDGDGDLDAVTCRARVPVFGSEEGQLLWLTNPGTYTSPWKPNILATGPDIFFEYAVLNSTDGPMNCIITSQFFTKKLAVYWTTDNQGTWTDPAKIQSRVIDDTIGAVFEVKLEDINNDGKVDLLVTNNGNNGSMFVYEIPDDFRTGSFKRHTLSTGYRPAHSGTGKGAPGSPFTVKVADNRKPIIFLSGDDNGNAFHLEPRSEDPSDWNYMQTTIVGNGGTIGQLAVEDVDGDGFKELFIPSYSTSEVFVFRLQT